MRDLAILEQVEWLRPGGESAVFKALGVGYGFTGRGDAAPAAHHCRQVHGIRVVTAEPGLTNPAATVRVEADGLLTRTPGEAVAVRTADCLPVLLADARRSVAVAVHAGWRGLSAGILGAAVWGLTAAPPALAAVVGPAIGRERFQVGREVVLALASATLGLTPTQAGLCIAKGSGDRWHVDLAAAAVFALVNAGLAPERIAVRQECTAAPEARWHSYRRDGAGCGSNWSWITL